MLIVGGGPGGLACAIRLGQLLEEHPEVRERLGEVPVAVLEKEAAGLAPPLRRGRRPEAAARALPRPADDGGPADLRPGRRRGRVCPDAALGVRIPAPPPMRNHGNYILSVSSSGASSASRPRRSASP